ncbi:ribosomal protein S2, flavodoxin-like domain-containing protein [Mycena floridula]|nr:ribosomal protein S2, flavodoxin-like domain-containing protein [Mycena floridula]
MRPGFLHWLSSSSASYQRRKLWKIKLEYGARHRSSWEIKDEELLNTHDEWARFLLQRSEQRANKHYMSQYGSTQVTGAGWKLRDPLNKPQGQTTISALLAAGAHFGHTATTMNPNFMPYAYGVRAGITIIDLDHTLPLLKRAANLVRAVARAGGSVLFVGTRADLRTVVYKSAERLGKQGYHVGDRWIPGTLTNKIHMFGTEKFLQYNIKPDLVILLNPLANLNLIHECTLQNIPTVGVTDSNVDPRIVMYPIPCNDESARTAEIVAGCPQLGRKRRNRTPFSRGRATWTAAVWRPGRRR